MKLKPQALREAISESRGFSYLELMIAVGIFSFVVAAIAAMNFQLQAGQVQSASLFHFSTIARNLAFLTTGQASWTNTINAQVNAQAMGCLKAATPCTIDGGANSQPLQSVPFALLDGSGLIVYSSINPKNGYSMSGATCATYSPAGSNSCPIRYTLQWSAQCTPGNCVNPQVKVSATLVYTPVYASTLAPPVINPAYYSMPDIYRTAQ